MSTSSLRYLRAALTGLVLLWLAFVAIEARRRWPQLPLYVNAADPAVQAAYQAAIQSHLIRAGELGLAVIAVALAMWWFAKRRTDSQ
jgi:hypothetical protein